MTARPPSALTVRDAAETLQVSVSFVYREIHTGRIRAIRVGRGWRISRAEIDRYLASGPLDPPTDNRPDRARRGPLVNDDSTTSTVRASFTVTYPVGLSRRRLAVAIDHALRSVDPIWVQRGETEVEIVLDLDGLVLDP